MIGQRGFWVGIAGSAGFLAIFIYLFVDFDTIGDVVSSANYAFILPSLIFYFMAVWFRALRWRYLLRPLIGSPQRAVYPVVVVGYMANNLIPVRMGEVIRSYYLGLRERVSAASAFGTIAVERAFDVVALLFFLALAWLFLPVTGLVERVAEQVPGGLPVLVAGSIAPFAVVAGTLALIAFASRRSVLAVADRLMPPLPGGLRARAMTLLGSLIDGLMVLGSARAMLNVFLLSLPVWLMEASMYYVISLGFDLHSQFDPWQVFAAILVFTAAANLAGVLPSSAGSWGPFDFFGAAALIALGVDPATATVYAVTVHVALWLPVTALGLVLLLADGMSLRRLMERARGRPVPQHAAAETAP